MRKLDFLSQEKISDRSHVLTNVNNENKASFYFYLKFYLFGHIRSARNLFKSPLYSYSNPNWKPVPSLSCFIFCQKMKKNPRLTIRNCRFDFWFTFKAKTYMQILMPPIPYRNKIGLGCLPGRTECVLYQSLIFSFL